MSNHQEQKVMMIEEDFVELTENYLGFDNQIIVYESL